MWYDSMYSSIHSLAYIATRLYDLLIYFMYAGIAHIQIYYKLCISLIVFFYYNIHLNVFMLAILVFKRNNFFFQFYKFQGKECILSPILSLKITEMVSIVTKQIFQRITTLLCSLKGCSIEKQFNDELQGFKLALFTQHCHLCCHSGIKPQKSFKMKMLLYS